MSFRRNNGGWWGIFKENRNNLVRVRRQNGHLGAERPTLQGENRCIYITGGHRSPRLYTGEGGDPYYTDYRGEAGEILTDPTQNPRLIGEDPVYSLMVGTDNRVFTAEYQRSQDRLRNDPTHHIVNPAAIEVANTNYEQHEIGMTPANQAKYALALSGEDQYRSLIDHRFSHESPYPDANREVDRYGGLLQTENLFAQRIRIFDPKMPPASEEDDTPGPFVPLVLTGRTDREKLRKAYGYVSPHRIAGTRMALASQQEWSKAWSTVEYGYTFEFHNFSYSKPWLMTQRTWDIENTAKSVARINPEFNFYDREYEIKAEEFLEGNRRRFRDILGRRSRLRSKNIWFGKSTEILQSKETQEKKGQLPFYIELNLPTQKEGPILRALRKSGLEAHILKDIVRKFDSRDTETIKTIKQAGYLSVGRQTGNTRASDSFNSYYESTVRPVPAYSEIQALEFYGSNNSLFNKFYEEVVAGERQGECGTYRDRIMLMGLRAKMEKILGDRNNRITYFETLPYEEYRGSARQQVYRTYRVQNRDGTYSERRDTIYGQFRSGYAGDNLRKAPCKTETLAYEIIKTSHDNDARQTFYVSNPKDDVLNFIDKQVDLRKRFNYSVNAFVAVYGIAYRYTYNYDENFWVEHQGNTRGLPAPDYSLAANVRDDISKAYPILDLYVHYVPSVKVFKVPVAYTRQRGIAPYEPARTTDGIQFNSAKIIDRPPTPPEVSFIPYRGINNKILVNLSDTIDSLGVGYKGVRYYAFSDDEQRAFETIRDNQILYENRKLDPASIEFKGEGDSKTIEVYRTTTKPMRGVEDSFEQKNKQPYLAFNIGVGEPHKIITLSEANSFKDDLRPNTKYYYTFRTTDRHDKISNPSPIYLVELVDEDGKMYAITDVYEPEIPKTEKIKDQKMVKYLEIKPAPISSEVFSTEGESDRIGMVSGEDSVFGKTFKIRIRSKDTGRLVDLNVKFKTGITVDSNLTPSEEVQEQPEECEEVEEE